MLLSRNTHQFRTKMWLEKQWDWNDDNWVCVFWHEPRNKRQTQPSRPIQRCFIKVKWRHVIGLQHPGEIIQGTCCFWLKRKKTSSSVCEVKEEKKIQWCRNPDRKNKLICAHDENYIWCWQRKLMQLCGQLLSKASDETSCSCVCMRACVYTFLCPGCLTGAGQSTIQ